MLHIDLNPHDLAEVTRILELYVPELEVWAFGSRVKWTAKAHSDLDLALITNSPLPLERFAQLREAFDESQLPIRVDLVDWARTSETFREIIRQQRFVLKPAAKEDEQHIHWPVVTLETALEALIDYRGKTPEKTTSGVPLVTAKVIKNGRIEKPTEFIAIESYDTWMRRGIPKAGDIVLTTEAPLGEVAQLGNEKVALAQRVITLRGKPDVLDNGYLLYLLQTEEMQEQLRSRATGTTVLEIKQSELRKITIRIPPIDLQRSAATTLRALDDRITLLRENNVALDAVNKALFKSWFVDFDPVRNKLEGLQPEGMDDATASHFPDSFANSELGLVPSGWQISKVEQLIELAYGKALKATDRKTGPVPVYGSGGITGFHNEALVREPSIVVGRKGTVGSLFWEDRPFFPIDTVFYVKTKIPLTYCFYQLQRLGLEGMNTDGAVPGLNRNNVYRLPVVFPPLTVILAFDEIASTLRQKMSENSEFSRTLATIRDALLPCLISGRVRTSNIESEGVTSIENS